MRKCLSVLLVALLLLSLWGCKSNAQPTLGLVHSATSSAYTNSLENGFRTAAKNLGYDCISVTPSDDSVDAQISLIEDLIKQGVKGIAISGNHMQGLESALQKAKDAGIPVVSLDRDTAGSQLFINPVDFELVGTALMDAVFDICGGEGSFAVISYVGGTNDPWVSSMKVLYKNDKYAQLSWADTSYCGELTQVEDTVNQLLEEYPDLEVICCTGADTLLACAKIVESLGVSVKVTGLGLPSQMKDYVGEDKACPYFFLWNPYEIGSCAAYALEALVCGATLEEGGSLITKQGKYKVFSGYPAEFTIVTGPPFCFTPEAMANDANIY